MARQSGAALLPMTNVPRPALPMAHFNILIKNLPDAPPVKYQKIQRPPKEVMVGRMKIPIPVQASKLPSASPQKVGPDHAFILRRLDTGAVSITTLFRAAFPSAPEAAERAELAWVAQNFDLAGANGGRDEDRVRFSGRWGPPTVARKLAEDYGLGHVVPALLIADPNAARQTDGSSPLRALSASSPAASPAPHAPAGPPPAKRRKEKEASPAPAPAPATAVRAKLKSPSPAPARRTTRARSRSAQPEPAAVRAPSRSPKKRVVRDAIDEYGDVPGSDETAVEAGEEARAEALMRPSMAEDVAEQRELIAKLKAGRAGALDATPADAAAKRVREDDQAPYALAIKEPEVEERALVSNSRVRGRVFDTPERRSALWGSLAFVAGLAGATILPTLFQF